MLIGAAVYLEHKLENINNYYNSVGIIRVDVWGKVILLKCVSINRNLIYIYIYIYILKLR